MDMIGKREFQHRFDISNSGPIVDFSNYMHRLELAIMATMEDAEWGEL